MKRLITGIVTLTTLAVGFWGCNDFPDDLQRFRLRDVLRYIIYVSGAGQREMV
jgi:hypothetical protein